MIKVVIVATLLALLAAAIVLSQRPTDDGQECYPGQGKIQGHYQC